MGPERGSKFENLIPKPILDPYIFLDLKLNSNSLIVKKLDPYTKNTGEFGTCPIRS